MSNIHTGISNLISWSLQIIYQKLLDSCQFCYQHPPPHYYSFSPCQNNDHFFGTEWLSLPFFSGILHVKKKKRQYQIIWFSPNSSCMHSESRFEKKKEDWSWSFLVYCSFFLFRFRGLLSYPLDVNLKAEYDLVKMGTKGIDYVCMFRRTLMLKMHSGVMYLLQGPCKWNWQKLLTLKTEIDLFR